ncbi:MAG: bifunctional aldolase/short-chain dehydrogenase [Hyphomonadaceae bacterium]
MKSLWSAEDAAAAVRHYAGAGVGEDVALRTYSARLLGRDRRLVLHGGGNTSVKTRARDVFGDDIDVLCVKGSGWDLATIEPAGHPAVRLVPLQRLRALTALSDEDMVNVLRLNLLDANAPNPSVETLLHAFMPDKFIDHSHSTALLTLADQPDAERIVTDLYGARAACVPYVMPGFVLSQQAGRARDEHADAHGLVLLKHGLFSFGSDARESYERMIALVTLAEGFIEKRRPARRARTAPAPTSAAATLLPRLRGAWTRASAKRWIFDLRDGEAARAVADDARVHEWARRGVITPDHVIRTKHIAFVADGGDVDAALQAYVREYEAYFARHNARLGHIKKQLDGLPRLVLAPGLGLIGVGKSATDAAISADIGELWAETLLDAEAIGRLDPVDEADTFDMEYWSLEQAKLGKSAEKQLARHVVLVTGGAGAIGSAIGKAFADQGAEIALLDIDAEKAQRVAAKIGVHALGVGCDVTDAQSVKAAFAAVVARFGGVDIVASNAGSAAVGKMADLTDETLRQSFELNFFAHQAVARAAIDVFRAQGVGGVLLFNVSKQALNPGPDFGAYGASKTALLALMRQYALEHGGEGVRANAINPDRIRSGLLTPNMVAARAEARGVTEQDYMSGNLLRREVTAEDVGQAFVFAALMSSTTGAIFPVDGGNIAAMPR